MPKAAAGAMPQIFGGGRWHRMWPAKHTAEQHSATKARTFKDIGHAKHRRLAVGRNEDDGRSGNLTKVFKVPTKCQAPGPLFPVRQDGIDASLLDRLLDGDQSRRLRGKERCVSVRACKVERTEGGVNPVMAGGGGTAKVRTDGGS